MTKSDKTLITPGERLLSLDLFRGLTMFLLIGEFTGLFSLMTSQSLKGTFIYWLGSQFHHHHWNGMHFWDLIQPFFMFIVGVAIPFAVANRKKKGDSYALIRKHAIKRAFMLLLLGWALYCIGPGRITFRFQNVLAQLSVTYLASFFLMRYSAKTQISVSIIILVVTEILYRTFPVAGFNQPFTPDHNFGAWFDMLISGELSGGHWVSFNAVPTTAHTIWGVLAGQLLMSNRSAMQKLKILILAGIIGLVVGYGLNPVTPIIKRIATTSFVFASGGWSLLALAISYWIVDILKFRGWVKPFAIVGMNPLFIYLFAHVGGGKFIAHIIKPFSMAAFHWAGELNAQMFSALIVWYLLWYICYWLYKNKIFIKI